MFKKTMRFLFAVRPGTSPTLAFYSGFYSGVVLTIYVAHVVNEYREEQAMRERWVAAEEEFDDFTITHLTPRD